MEKVNAVRTSEKSASSCGQTRVFARERNPMKTKEFRELSNVERFTFDYFLGCMDGQVAFALIGSQTVIILEDIDSSAGEDALREALEEAADETLSDPPDFETMVMDDGYGIVIVGRLGIVTAVKLEEDLLESGRMAVGVGVALRNVALSACENAELIAVAFPD